MDVRIVSEDYKFQRSEMIFWSSILLVLAVIGVGISLWGWSKRDSFVERCSKITSAYELDSWTEEYQWVRYGDGLVHTGYVYYTKYEYEIGDKTYQAVLKSNTPIEYNGLCDVYYNPNDTSENFIDMSDFDQYVYIIQGNGLREPFDSSSTKLSKIIRGY